MNKDELDQVNQTIKEFNKRHKIRPFSGKIKQTKEGTFSGGELFVDVRDIPNGTKIPKYFDGFEVVPVHGKK